MKFRSEYISNSAAILCLIHCMAMPFLVAFAPIFGILLFPAWLDKGIIIFAVLVSLLTLCWGYFNHKKLRCFAFLLAATSWFYLAHNDIISRTHTQHVFYSLVGASCMVTANFMNRKLCKTCNHCKEDLCNSDL